MFNSPNKRKREWFGGGHGPLHRSIIVLVFAFLMMGQRSEAGFTHTNQENATAFSLIGTGTAITANGTFPLTGGMLWPTTGTVTETLGGAFSNDTLLISGTAVHAGNAGGVFRYRFSANASGFSDRVANIEPTVNGVAFPHGTDTDQFVATLDVQIRAHTFKGGDITGYNLLVQGKHVTGTSTEFTAALRTSDGSLPGEPFATVAMILDNSNDTFDISVETNGLPLSALTGGSLRQGPNGPDFFDLGDPSQWTTLGTTGLFRVIDNSAFPQQFLPDLLAGNVFADIRTTSPGSEMLGPVQGFSPTVVPEPSTMVLSAIGSLGLLGFVWRRQKSAA
jgi:hypothetical protein